MGNISVRRMDGINDIRKITIKQSIDVFIKALETENKAPQTIQAYKVDINVFYEFIKETLNNKVRYVRDLKYYHFEIYKESLSDQYAFRTACRKFNCLRTYIRIMNRCNYISNDIVLKLNTDKYGNQRRDKNTSASEIVKHIMSTETLKEVFRRVKSDTTKNKYRDIAMFYILSYGLRRSEILELTWEDFNLTEQTMLIRRPKTSSFDNVSISKNAVDALKQHFRMCSLGDTLTTKVFNLSTTPYNNTIKKYVSGLKTESGNPVITGHSFRHTFITLMVRAGNDLPYIQQYVGTTLETLEVYTHLSVRDSVKIVDSLDQILAV